MFGRLKPDENRQKPPTSVQNGASRSSSKKRKCGRSFFWALPRQAPASPSQNGPNQSLPPHTPQISFAWLRLYLYSAQAFGWLSFVTFGNHGWHISTQGGVGVGVIMFFASWHRDYMLRIAKLWDLLLHLHTDIMPHYHIFSWLWAAGGGVGWVWSCSLPLGTGTICYALLNCEIFSCTCAPTSCHTIMSSPGSGLRGVGWGGVGVIMFFASWHRDYMLRIAKLWDLLLHLHTDIMPHYHVFSWLWAAGGGVGWVW